MPNQFCAITIQNYHGLEATEIFAGMAINYVFQLKLPCLRSISNRQAGLNRTDYSNFFFEIMFHPGNPLKLTKPCLLRI
jgi:hypothetical protein